MTGPQRTGLETNCSCNNPPPSCRVIGDAEMVDSQLPELPELLTSFGGAIDDGVIYIYGGHTGSAHSYSTAEQSDRFYCLDLAEGRSWETLPTGPRLQGLALVGHGGSIYRIGGFTALNGEGETQDLQSQSACARYDIAKGKWAAMTPLPEPRSSFDAAVTGHTLFVVGGWALKGEKESVWRSTAWSIDLNSPQAEWKPLADPPFQRRALAVATLDKKVYVIGGMQRDGNATTRVDVYDPEQDRWQVGPSLEGDDMTGFGCCAFATGGNLFVSTIRGHIQRLSDDGTHWEVICTSDPARFFHRMLPRNDHSLLLIGGANMSIGKFKEIDQVEIKPGSRTP